MKKNSRLFDCLTNQLEHFPQEDMLAAKENGVWRKYSTAKVQEMVNQLSAGLLSLGISGNDMSTEGRDKIAILSANRPEWVILDLAVQQIGAVLVPIYPTLNASELEFVLNDAQVKLVFVNNTELHEKVAGMRHNVPSLREIYTFNQVPGAHNWQEVLDAGVPEYLQQVKPIADKIRPEDLVTIIYTSGTTGTPKGVMLSHNNVASNVADSSAILPPGGENLRSLSFLPLNHIFERMVTYLYLFNGISIYYAENLESIGDNLKEVKPHMFTTVPRLLEKVYERIMEKGAALSGIKKKLFDWAVNVGSRYDINKSLGFGYNLQLSLANKLIFNKWREGLGGEIKCIVTGAAACQVRLLKVFTAARIPIMEGYGLTETSPVISVNRYDVSERKFGTVGPVIKNIEVKLAEDGEICCKGPNVMMGYYKRPDLTDECVKDGWFHTGDIGVWEEYQGKRFLKITDRKKEIFKTSGGKYVAPQPIENKMKESNFIEQMMVVGPERKFAGALIVPSFTNLKAWCAEHQVTENDPKALINHPRINDLYREIVEQFNESFNHVEQIKKFELLPAEWTVDGGELTPTLKLKRKVIMEKYRDIIERIYAE
jgi:long-chain acyl-CoA synthetase